MTAVIGIAIWTKMEELHNMECLWVISSIFFLLFFASFDHQVPIDTFCSWLELSIGFIYAPTEPYYVYFCYQFSVLAGLYA